MPCFKTLHDENSYVFFTIHTDAFSDTRTFLVRYVNNNHMISQYLM